MRGKNARMIRLAVAGCLMAGIGYGLNYCSPSEADDAAVAAGLVGPQAGVDASLFGVDGGYGGTVVGRTWWPQPQDGSNYGWTSGDDNGDCFMFPCDNGNYNQSYKRSLCQAGRTPGASPVFYNGHYQFWGLKWDKMGTGQDHQGVCVSIHPADVGRTDQFATRRIFHDGCTGFPDGNPKNPTKGPLRGRSFDNWGQVFHGACVVHDLCYKAEPSFSGKSKSYCDDQMETEAKKICNASYEHINGGFLQGKTDLEKCLAEASNARSGLKLGSDKHYIGFNYPFDWRVSGVCGTGKYYDSVTSQCCPNGTTCYLPSSGGGGGGGGGGYGGY